MDALRKSMDVNVMASAAPWESAVWLGEETMCEYNDISKDKNMTNSALSSLLDVGVDAKLFLNPVFSFSVH